MKYALCVYLWTVSLLYFGVLCIVGIVLTFLISQERLDPWLKKRLRFLFKLIHTPVQVEGAEKIDHQRTYLFMANHVSIFDIPLLGATIPNFVRGIEAKRQFKWPLYGWAIRRLGNIPIDRKNIHASLQSLKKAETCLQKGRSLVILPEGHRTVDGKLRPFKRLPFFLAQQAGVDVVPIGLSGLFHLKRKGCWLIRPTTIKVKFGDIVPGEKAKSLSPEQLREYVRNIIQNLIEKP